MAETPDDAREPTRIAVDLAQIEAVVVGWAQAVAPDPTGQRGRPRILPAAVLWAGLAIGILRGATSQAGIWRVILELAWWRRPAVPLTDEAVYRRLADADPSPMAELFAGLTQALVARVEPWRQTDLAPFATDVVVLDETTLDPIARTLPILRGVPTGDDRVLPGKLAGVFDVRRQLWRTVRYLPDPRQNEKVAARDLAAALAPGALVLADLGYFGFQWFDDLTDAGHFWLSKLRAKTSTERVHTFYEDADTLDALVWLGAYRADKAKHLVRLVRFRHGETTWTYLTNVTDPETLPIPMIAALYARRWDIELAVKLVKRDLGLHLIWSAKPPVILHQVWAVLTIAQILQALRLEIAGRAGVDLFEVSIPILVQTLPLVAAQEPDPLGFIAAHGKRLGVIRRSRRLTPAAPDIPPERRIPPPPDLVREREPRYAGRRCAPRTAPTAN
jgi:hypothetical protein